MNALNHQVASGLSLGAIRASLRRMWGYTNGGGKLLLVLLMMILALTLAFPSYAVELTDFTHSDFADSPLKTALEQLGALAPSIKAMIGFVAFVVALIALAAMRNMGPVLFYIGVAIFAGTGLAIGTSIIGAPLSVLG